MKYLLLFILLFSSGGYALDNAYSIKSRISTGHWSIDKNNADVIVFHGIFSTGKYYYNKKSLMETIETVKRNNEQFATDEAYYAELSRLQEGLTILENQ